MESPRSGFRRAALTSWALAGIGAAGVAGASALAYADTVKPAPVESPAVIVPDALSDTAANLPPAPPAVEPPPAPETTPPPPAPEPLVTQAPAQTQAPVQTYTPTYQPKQTYTPKPTVQQQAPAAAAPTTKSQPAFPIRQSHVPLGGGGTSGGNNFSPHVTVSRGS